MSDLRCRQLSYLALEAPRAGQASYVHVTEIVAGLRRRGWTVRLFQPSYTDKPVKPGTLGRLLAYGLTQISLWAGRPRGGMIYVRAHFMALPTALLARLFGVPILHEVNGPYEDIFVTYPWLSRFRRPLEAMQRLQYRWADHLMPVTAELAEWLQRETGHDRITVISNGANTDLFHPDAARPADAPEGPHAIFFGGLARWHGVDTMLQAIKHPSWPPGVRLVVIGAGQESERVRRAAAENDAIVFLGPRPYETIAGFVSRAIVGLVPITDPGGRSRTGLFPLKLFETLACGVPVIVTDLPGQADLIRDHDCGIVIPPEDPQALAEAVRALAKDPEGTRAMGRRGMLAIHRDHSWDRRAADVHSLLSRVTPARG